MVITDVKATPVAVPMKESKTQSKVRKGPGVCQAVIVQVLRTRGT